jgi:hypothetical protein
MEFAVTTVLALIQFNPEPSAVSHENIALLAEGSVGRCGSINIAFLRRALYNMSRLQLPEKGEYQNCGLQKQTSGA